MNDQTKTAGKSPDDWPELTAAFCDTVRAAIEGGMPPDEILERLGQVAEVIAGDVADLRRKSRVAGGAKEETEGQPAGGIIDGSE